MCFGLAGSKGKAFLNGFQISKIFVLSNGSKSVRNVIQMASKELFFPKDYKYRPAAGGFAPRPS